MGVSGSSLSVPPSGSHLGPLNLKQEEEEITLCYRGLPIPTAAWWVSLRLPPASREYEDINVTNLQSYQRMESVQPGQPNYYMCRCVRGLQFMCYDM